MKRIIAALLVGVGVSVAAAGCGGGDLCSEGCNRMRSCAEKLNCALLDPVQQPRCNQSKAALLANDCGPLATVCPSDVKARFEQAATCTLDTATCTCP